MSTMRLVTVKFKNAKQLAEFYLPFLKRGGFYFATNEHDKVNLHERVQLSIELPDGDTTPIEAEGIVAMINIASAEKPHHITDFEGLAIAIDKAPDFLFTRIQSLLKMHQATQSQTSA